MPDTLLKTPSRDRKSEKMSEKKSRTIIITGTACLAVSVFTALGGLLPLREMNKCYSFTGRGSNPDLLSPLEHVSGSDPVNSDDLYDLTEFPGVGETIAAFIIEERENNGPYHYPEDLIAVKGIGTKKAEQIRPLLMTETDESEE